MTRVLVAMCIVLAGCQNVTVRPDGGERAQTPPTYAKRQNFFMWGLAPEAKFVDVDVACAGKSVDQMRAQTTFVDGLLGLITLGIYSPRTAQVWCEGGQS